MDALAQAPEMGGGGGGQPTPLGRGQEAQGLCSQGRDRAL